MRRAVVKDGQPERGRVRRAVGHENLVHRVARPRTQPRADRVGRQGGRCGWAIGGALIALGITCTALSIVLGGLGAIARILWKDTGIGLKWAVVQFPAGGGGGGEGVFAVTLTRVGGSNGTATSAASWTYDVKRADTNEQLGTNVNPSTSPHKWKRPIGRMAQADFGYAHFGKDTEGERVLVLGWINEIPEVAACPNP
jgi:hypothetical protein